MRTLLFAAVLMLTALPVDAQRGTGNQGGAAMRFREMDLNRDGVITRNEWRGTRQAFDMLDWNDDGVLSGDEVRVGNRRDDNEPPVRDSDTAEEFTNWTDAGFRSLDQNRDGRINASEWYYDPDVFDRVDQNRNGSLERAEFLASDVDDNREDRFEYLDVNGNGRIERNEWEGSAASFNALDRNRNGVLSRVEVGDEPAAQPRDQFANLDVNRNNVITIDEWHWSRRSFEIQDTNRDGALTRQELTVAEANSLPAVGAGQAGAGQGNPGGGAATQNVIVDATQRWTDTGVDVRPGDTVVFSATGTVRMSEDEGDTASPAGSTRGRQAADAPVSAESAGGLIARVGNATPVFIGERRTYRVPTGGRLYLSVNDDHLLDNGGQFRVNISVNTR